MRANSTERALLVAAVLIVYGIASLSARALARVWVATRHDPWVLPYPGMLGLGYGALMVGLAAATALLCLRRYPLRPGSAYWMAAGLVFTGGATLGVVEATLCQGWLHVGRLAIVGGWYHPRALIGAASLSLALGLICLASSFVPGEAPADEPG